MGRTTTVIGSILLLAVAFVAINMIANYGLRGARIDATASGLYTLTAGSRNIAQSPQEPISLTLYYSAKLAAGQAQLQSYGQRVREMLEEYARLSKGKIQLTVIDPEPFTEAEDDAAAAGISAIPMNAAGENLYFGLEGTNKADGIEVIPFFDPRQEKLLEYNISKLIYSLANPKKKVAGLISSISIEGGFTMNPQTRQPVQTRPWRIIADLRETMEVKNLGIDTKEIPAEVTVLLVVHPKNLSPATLYAIDQYVLAGGKAIFFVDPNCDNDPDGGNPMMGGGGSKASQLDTLLDAYGVEIVSGKFAADLETALSVPAGQGSRETVQAVQFLGLKKDNLNPDDPVTTTVERLNFGTAGVIRAKAVPTQAAAEGQASTSGLAATIVPLVETSAKASIMDTGALMMPDPKALLSQFVPGSEKLTLAARLSGKVRSAFPQGRPAVEGESPEDTAKFTKAQPLAESKDSINIMLVADVDVLANMFWVREQELLPGMVIPQKFADNGDFFLSAVDNMSGSNDLLSVRARQESARPFTLVEDMQKRANERFQSEQQMLEKELAGTQAKINELQGMKQGQDAFILTPEQQKEVQKFQQQALETRRKLREVKSNLRKDIEALGTQLKFINIGLIPILVTIGAVGLGWYRVSKRRVKTE